MSSLGINSTVMLPLLLLIFPDDFFTVKSDTAVVINNYQPSYMQISEIINRADNFKEKDGIEKIEKIEEDIVFKDVSFSYDEKKKVLDNCNLKIIKNKITTLVGDSGVGKSTIIDLLMGLNLPTKGQILIDGKNLHKDSDPLFLQGWRRSIAHVPQDIFLTDSSFEENIAFGISPENINSDLVQKEMSYWMAIKIFIKIFIKNLITH